MRPLYWFNRVSSTLRTLDVQIHLAPFRWMCAFQACGFGYCEGRAMLNIALGPVGIMVQMQDDESFRVWCERRRAEGEAAAAQAMGRYRAAQQRPTLSDEQIAHVAEIIRDLPPGDAEKLRAAIGAPA